MSQWKIVIFIIDLGKIYYPLLATIGVPVNLVTIVVLSRGKCRLFSCVTCYLVVMAVADLLIIIIDLIMRRIPNIYQKEFLFVYSIPMCNIHGILLHATTDCSAWFTVAFTTDRFVAICCQKLKWRYCTEKTEAVALRTVTILSILKDITWYFILSNWYELLNAQWICPIPRNIMEKQVWLTIMLLHPILTLGIPFVLLNAFTVRHILLASRAHRRPQGHSNVESRRDPEVESQRKSIMLLFVISGNFILLWSIFVIYSIWAGMWLLGYVSALMPGFVGEIGFMLQLLGCTKTFIYAMSQSEFREQVKNVVRYPFAQIVNFIQ